MRYCPNCGAKIKVGAKKCPQCGYQLQKPSAQKRRNQKPEQQTSDYSRASRYHSNKPLLQYWVWLKDNLLTDLLALILVILTWIYVGKIVGILLIIALILIGYFHASQNATNLDDKIRLVFGRGKTYSQNKLARKKQPKTTTDNYYEPDYSTPINPKQKGVHEVTDTLDAAAPTNNRQKRSWLIFLVAAVLISTSYWSNFFQNNLFANPQNNVVAPSLAQTIRQALGTLNYIFNLQINPDLGLWIIAFGPLLALIGSLMPNRFGRRLAVIGAVIGVLIYLGGFVILRLGFNIGANYGLTTQLALGSAGTTAISGSVVLLILAVWQSHRRR